MVLRYQGCPEPVGHEHYHELPGMVVGHSYEVAEIFEMEGHVMVREPGAPSWPVPGQPGFGIHPEWFEEIDEPIPIVSCGFEYKETLCGFFGVLLDEPEQVAAIRAVHRLKGPIDDSETFDMWRAREASTVPDRTARAIWEWFDDGFEEGVVESAFLIDPPLGIPFAYAGWDGQAVFRNDVRHADLRNRIERFLEALDIRGVVPRVLAWCYWRGTGQKRLINPRTRAKFLYGTRPEWTGEPGAASSDEKSIP